VEDVEEVEKEVVEKHNMYSIVNVQILEVVQCLQPVTVQDIVRSQSDPQEPGVPAGMKTCVCVCVCVVVVVVMTLQSLSSHLLNWGNLDWYPCTHSSSFLFFPLLSSSSILLSVILLSIFTIQPSLSYALLYSPLLYSTALHHITSHRHDR
jgi:hypothetical protein